MFRLISSNTLAGLRPILLRKVRGNTSSLKLATNANLDTSFDHQHHFALHISRNNSTRAAALINDKQDKITGVKVDTTVLDHQQSLQAAIDVEKKVSQFNDLLRVLPRFPLQYPHMLKDLKEIYSDDAVKAAIPEEKIQAYAEYLNSFVTSNRNFRLSKKQNRDSDMYQNSTLNNDVLVKAAILDFADSIIRGVVTQNLNDSTLRLLFLAMLQTECFSEMTELWEAGVNDEATNRLYLNHTVLALVLPVAYKTDRFSYEEILKIYNYNTKAGHVHYSLLTALGKIAILAGDNTKGLDMMEGLMKAYEANPKQARAVLHCLGDLHMNFIGHCTDIKVAKHFFDKVVEFELPYKVTLKAPYVVSMLENCHKYGESFDTILNFWRTSIQYYAAADKALNSRYSLVNTCFFSIFFKIYPTLTEESYRRLREILSIYANIKPLDEIFLNAILTNFSWKDKTVYNQIIENYDIHNIPRTQVSYRVALKNLGQIENISNEDILEHWFDSLRSLDREGFNYIPIADWAALRDCTILSPYFAERTDFYLKVLDTFKDYHQDEKACLRFARYWLARDDVKSRVFAITSDNKPLYNCDIPIEEPQFAHLKKNVDYKAMTASLVEFCQKKSS